MSLAEEQVEYVVQPGQAAINVGEIVARNVFEQYGNPASITLDLAATKMLCALAIQATLNGATGKWQ